MLLNGKKLDMEVDTGAALLIISEATRKFMFADETLHPSSLVLKTYTDERMEVMGTLNMQWGQKNVRRACEEGMHCRCCLHGPMIGHRPGRDESSRCRVGVLDLAFSSAAYLVVSSGIRVRCVPSSHRNDTARP